MTTFSNGWLQAVPANVWWSSRLTCYTSSRVKAARLKTQRVSSWLSRGSELKLFLKKVPPCGRSVSCRRFLTAAQTAALPGSGYTADRNRLLKSCRFTWPKTERMETCSRCWCCLDVIGGSTPVLPALPPRTGTGRPTASPWSACL